MKIKNFHMAVGEIVPKLDGEFSEDVNVHASSRGIMFNKIGKSGWEGRDGAEAFEQIALFARFECSEKIENFNGDEHTRVAHFN